jgi:hypothetical protein
MNFYGLETEREDFVCSWTHPPEYYLDKLQTDMGINTIRLPFSYQYVQKGDFQKLHHFMRETNTRNLSIILDYHRTSNTHQGAVPEEGISRTDFLHCWLRVIQELSSYDNLWGIGVFNEIHNDSYDYITQLHLETIDAIETLYPDRFHYFLGCGNWGTDCTHAQFWDLPVWNRSFVEIHLYHFTGNSSPPTWDVHMPHRIPSNHWFVGEVGFKYDVPSEKLWAEGFFTYLKSRNISNVCLWTIAHSQDTNGWWQDDCTTFRAQKAAMVTSFWQDEWNP